MKKILLLFAFLFPLLLMAQGKRPLVWVIDAGHGGHDIGTKGRNMTEKEINLKVSQEVVRLIRQHKPGIKVITTRRTDKFVSLSERCNIANRAKADLFLSIHVNWARKKSLRGTETFYSTTTRSRRRNPNAAKSELLSRLLQNNYAASGRPIYRGVRTNRKYVTVNTNMPSALTEIAFISNTHDAAYITSEKGMMETARMIFNALMEYYATTQAKTHTKTLNTLRSTKDKKSGVKNSIRVSVKGGGKTKTVVEEEEEKPSKAKEKAAEKPKAKETPAAKEKQPATKTKEKTDSKKTTTTKKEDTKPVFSIQVLTSPRILKAKDKRLKGLSPVTFVKNGKIYQGLYARNTDYNQVRRALKTVRKKFPDAFIVAHMGEKQITTAEALEIFRGKKKAK